MKEDRFTELALEALICRDEQKKEARLNKLMKQEKAEKTSVHYDVPQWTEMVDGDDDPPYQINKTDEV